jgi:hypothetical protein
MVLKGEKEQIALYPNTDNSFALLQGNIVSIPVNARTPDNIFNLTFIDASKF